MKPTLKTIESYADMEDLIQSSEVWFVGSFMIEILNNYSKLRNKESKKEFIKNFQNSYVSLTSEKRTRNRINCVIRIIESNMVKKAMEYVLNTNDKKIGCEESKNNAKYILEKIKSNELELPSFE